MGAALAGIGGILLQNGARLGVWMIDDYCCIGGNIDELGFVVDIGKRIVYTLT
jgi:hypothetical protein